MTSFEAVAETVVPGLEIARGYIPELAARAAIEIDAHPNLIWNQPSMHHAVEQCLFVSEQGVLNDLYERPEPAETLPALGELAMLPLVSDKRIVVVNKYPPRGTQRSHFDEGFAEPGVVIQLSPDGILDYLDTEHALPVDTGDTLRIGPMLEHRGRNPSNDVRYSVLFYNPARRLSSVSNEE